MSDEAEAVCTCPPGSYGLGCEIHWEIVAAELVDLVKPYIAEAS